MNAFLRGAALLVALCVTAPAGAAESIDYKAILAKTPAGVLATEDGTQPPHPECLACSGRRRSFLVLHRRE